VIVEGDGMSGDMQTIRIHAHAGQAVVYAQAGAGSAIVVTRQDGSKPLVAPTGEIDIMPHAPIRVEIGFYIIEIRLQDGQCPGSIKEIIQVGVRGDGLSWQAAIKARTIATLMGEAWPVPEAKFKAALIAALDKIANPSPSPVYVLPKKMSGFAH
jgi:hypothetical protein